VKTLLLFIGQDSGLLLLISQGSGLLLLIGQGSGLLLLIGQGSGLLLSIIIANSVTGILINDHSYTLFGIFKTPALSQSTLS
jgi:hypothetical protein